MKTADRFEFMRLFVRIAETGSLSAAAQSLGVSQPSRCSACSWCAARPMTSA
jgi:hypothetical protein